MSPGRKSLTDKQWADIVRFSGLPSAARPIVEATIGAYRYWQRAIDASKTPHETREELDRLCKDTEALITRLKAVSDVVDPQRLRSAIYELERLAIWIGLARDRIPAGQRGAKRQATPAYFLVNHLNQILERFTGKTITRSPKRPNTTVEYVKTVCRIADPDIGDGTIIGAMRKEIRYYRPIPPEPEGVIPPPKRRGNKPMARKPK